ncbi:MAG: hypothetical protein ACI89J_001461 [Hyphomicrobiaceae bacterium]|jgi:hypothetical protein
MMNDMLRAEQVLAETFASRASLHQTHILRAIRLPAMLHIEPH